MQIDKDIIQKFDRPGPRYTSYPTAPEWDETISPHLYRQKLREFGQNDKTLSLYVHIPFCESLCYFCACTMNVRKQDDKYGDEYIDHLFKELDLVAINIGRIKTIRQLHWGGGTPSFLCEAQMKRLYGLIADRFRIDPEAEIAIEVDPRRVTQEKVETLRALGFNRISIGVQDFNESVQKVINRIQPYEIVAEFNRWCRDLKYHSVNFDLVYGLPSQTLESFRETIQKTIDLRPDRIALYSFAYVPWLKKHQSKFDPKTLPSVDEKLAIFLTAREIFLKNGYEAIAMDHFALKDDELTKAFKAGKLYRNFMGYTVKPADAYIGMGTSAIGFLENAYFQNYKTIPEYYRLIEQGEFPVERGKMLSEDDLIRQWVITALMCNFRIEKKNFTRVFGYDFDGYFRDEKDHLIKCVQDGLIDFHEDMIIVTDLGKIFVRNICMGFDWYLRQRNAHLRFSRTV